MHEMYLGERFDRRTVFWVMWKKGFFLYAVGERVAGVLRGSMFQIGGDGVLKILVLAISPTDRASIMDDR